MVRLLWAQLVAIAVGVVAAVGALDAAIGRTWDLVALFATVLVGSVAIAVALRSRRRLLSLRPDLAAALTERSRLTGEPLERIADRAVATYLAALDPDVAGRDHEPSTPGEPAALEVAGGDSGSAPDGAATP